MKKKIWVTPLLNEESVSETLSGFSFAGIETRNAHS
jgi:hypothetical protein